MSANPDDQKFVEQSLGGLLSLVGILAAVIGILLTLYEAHQGLSVTEAYRWLIFGAALGIALAGLAAGMSIAYLRGRQVSVRAIVCLLILVIALLTTVSLIVVVVTLF